MDNLTDLHRRALDATGAVVAAIGPDQWSLATPCEGWDVRTLATHVVAGNLWAAELASGRTIEDVGTALDGDVLGADPSSAYTRSAAAAATAFEAPGALEAPCAVSYGPVPGSIYAGHRTVDVFVHGWDLAKATGQNTTLNPELVDACLAIVEPQLDILQASGQFGTPASSTPGDSPQVRLLHQLGRQH